MTLSHYERNVFINCPFDERYKPLFNALVFAVTDCDFQVRCSLEEDDASEIRVEKIIRIIRESKHGIHDISRTELDSLNSLPRFNMPFELGIFLAAKKFGTVRQKEKVSLILDCEQYRYQKFLSDIAGQDIKSHDNDPQKLISAVRNWLQQLRMQRSLRGGSKIFERYLRFNEELPILCDELSIGSHELTYADYTNLVSTWVNTNP